MNDISYTLAKMAEERVRLEQALAPSRAMADLIEGATRLSYLSSLDYLTKSYQQPTYITAAAEIARAMQPPPYLDAVSQMMSALEQESRVRSELIRASSYADDVIQ